MNANEMTFGIEIECCLPDGLIQCGGYHCGRQIAVLPLGWNAQRDCSIHAEAGMTGVEIVSPVLNGADGLRQVLAVCKWLNDNGAKVNASTGFHVHVGWPGNAIALKRLVHSVAGFEKALFASTGTHRREGNRFCKAIKEEHNFITAFKCNSTAGQTLIRDRYHILNVTNIGTAKNTVEFRVFAGTTNASKIIGYVRLCLGFVEKAVKTRRLPKWDSAATASRKGEGQSQLVRLFYYLGWTKGREPAPYGAAGDENDLLIPTIDANKKELMRLARKYDSRNEEPGTQPPAILSYTDEQLIRWERRLSPSQPVRIRLSDGTDCTGHFVRRYAQSLLVRVSHLCEPILVPRVGTRRRTVSNGAFPVV